MKTKRVNKTGIETLTALADFLQCEGVNSAELLEFIEDCLPKKMVKNVIYNVLDKWGELEEKGKI